MADDFEIFHNGEDWNRSDKKDVSNVESIGSVHGSLGADIFEYCFVFLSIAACILIMVTILGSRHLRQRPYFTVVNMHVVAAVADIVQLIAKDRQIASNLYMKMLQQCLLCAQNLAVVILVVFWRRDQCTVFCPQRISVARSFAIVIISMPMWYVTPFLYFRPEIQHKIQFAVFNLLDYAILLIVVMCFNIYKLKNAINLELGIANTFLVLRFGIYFRMTQSVPMNIIYNEYVLEVLLLLAISYPIFNLVYLYLFDKKFASAAKLCWPCLKGQQQSSISNSCDDGVNERINATEMD